jgi:hypothetical protein
MYSDLAISTLTDRIKWNASLDSGFTIALSEDNATGTSGKHFQSFHNLVSIDNLYASVPEIGMDETRFNALLEDIRLQATLQIINDVLERNKKYDPIEDYSNTIITNAALFDTAVGYKVATNVLEMFLASSRSNLHERNSKLSASNLKLELKGFKNDNGYVVAAGIESFYQEAVRKAASKIFPFEVIINSEKIW